MSLQNASQYSVCVLMNCNVYYFHTGKQTTDIQVTFLPHHKSHRHLMRQILKACKLTISTDLTMLRQFLLTKTGRDLKT